MQQTLNEALLNMYFSQHVRQVSKEQKEQTIFVLFFLSNFSSQMQQDVVFSI
jgi:hypothetical protein